MQELEYSNIYRLEDTHWWYQGTYGLVSDFLKARLTPCSSSICDAGCGSGGLMQKLIKEGFLNSYGFDISSYALEQLRKRQDINGRVYLGDAGELSLRSCSLDAITCLEVLYHANVHTEEFVLREFFRVLKPQGIMILQVPAFEFMRGSHDVVTMTRKRYRLNEVKEYVKQAGFRIELCVYRNSWLFPLLLFWRLFSRINIRNQGSIGTSDLTRIPRCLNALLYFLMQLENKLLNKISFPFGTSVFCVALKD